MKTLTQVKQIAFEIAQAHAQQMMIDYPDSESVTVSQLMNGYNGQVSAFVEVNFVDHVLTQMAHFNVENEWVFVSQFLQTSFAVNEWKALAPRIIKPQKTVTIYR